MALKGLRPYRHYGTGEMVQPAVFSAGLMVCYSLYSLVFISYILAKKSPWWSVAPYSLYLSCSTVLLFCIGIVLLGAMHAPPYWFIRFIDLVIVAILHFLIFPLLLGLNYYHKRKTK